MKNAFIPKAYRPTVPGSKLERPNMDTNQTQSFEKYPMHCVFVISARTDIVADQFLQELDFDHDVKHLYYDELGVE